MAFPWIIMVVSFFFFYVAEVWKKVTLLHYRGMEKALVGRVARQALDCYNCLGT